MSAEFTPQQRKELLDDFYTECDELLVAVRTHLAELEASPTGPASATAIEALFRNLHTLKGNSTIVGLRGAEELAHAAENYLGSLQRGDVSFSDAGLELLIDAAHQLERTIAAHRQEQALPDTAHLQTRLNAISGKKRPARASDAEPSAPAASKALILPTSEEKTKAAREKGLHPWLFNFSPTRELDERGINVTSLRSRLSGLGEIIHATPSVHPGGVVAFEFLVALREMPDPAHWENDGVALRFLETPETQTATAASIETAHLPAGNDQSTSLFIAPSHIVRVDLARLDDLMRIAGELVIHRSRLEDRINQVAGDRSGLKEVNLSLTRSMRELREAITRVRLVPVAEIFTRMPFVVRDLGRESGKKVRLVIEGQHTTIDKFLVERLKEPLLHLVRNAFSHGIEIPEKRLASGKPAEGTIVLRAASAGESVVIQIRDDGEGVDPAVIAARATALGLPLPEKWDDASLLAVLCSPGFSTRLQADHTSGRGVGMAIVRTMVSELGGTLSLKSEKGVGSEITLRLPLTLSIVEALIVSVADQICAVPQSFVEEIVLVPEKQIQTIKQTEVAPYRTGLLPIVRLRKRFGLPAGASPEFPVLVISTERGSAGLAVDRVISQREVVVRAIKDPLVQVPGISGATELGDGKPVLILDALAITKGAVRPHFASQPGRFSSL